MADRAPWLTPPIAVGAPFETIVRRRTEAYREGGDEAVARIEIGATGGVDAMLSRYVRHAPVSSRELWILVLMAFASCATSTIASIR